jgi:uncharacterized protein YdiU (UPF0061 family)
MHVGFIHGVMNTDNMAICGETIDYGPCAFMDVCNQETVFSSIDRNGRYAYGNQPHIAQWNLARLAEALLPLLHADEKLAIEKANEAIHRFQDRFQKHWLAGMRSKLGLFTEETDDSALIQELLDWMQQSKADFTNTFATLSRAQPVSEESDYHSWHQRWIKRLTHQQQSMSDSLQLMQRHNPAYIPRNHKVEEALSAATEKADLSIMHRLLEVLSKPFDYTSSLPEYSRPAESGSCGYQTFCGT